MSADFKIYEVTGFAETGDEFTQDVAAMNIGDATAFFGQWLIENTRYSIERFTDIRASLKEQAKRPEPFRWH